MNRMQTVKIEWSKPIRLDNRANSCNFCEEEGLYIISTKYIRHGIVWERYIYVGETRKGFDIRFEQHLNTRKQSKWVSERGTKFVRFGRILNKPTFINDDKWFLLTLESSIIQTIKDLPRVRLVNTRQVKTYSIFYDLIIENQRCRLLPKYINTRDLYDVIEYIDNENVAGKKIISRPIYRD